MVDAVHLDPALLLRLKALADAENSTPDQLLERLIEKGEVEDILNRIDPDDESVHPLLRGAALAWQEYREGRQPLSEPDLSERARDILRTEFTAYLEGRMMDATKEDR